MEEEERNEDLIIIRTKYFIIQWWDYAAENEFWVVLMKWKIILIKRFWGY